MSEENIIHKTGRYIDDYLAAFAVDGRREDIRYYHCGIEIHPSQVSAFGGDVDLADMHKQRFDELSSRLPGASMRQFRDRAARMSNVVLVDIANMHLGSDFSLWVASQNPSAEVHIYNPDVHRDFYNFLFNDIEPDTFFKMCRATPYDAMHQEWAVNNLFKENGLANVRFHQHAITEEMMHEISEGKRGRPVLFLAQRINDLVGPIARVVSRQSNADMIITPFISEEVKHYQDDPVMQLIDTYRRIRQGQKRGVEVAPDADARSRLFSAMQQYYSLRAASSVGERAKVYRSGDLAGKSVFHHPTHYVSTIRPEARVRR